MDTIRTFFERRPVLTAVLASVGALWSASHVLNFASFFYLHALHKTRLDRYQLSGSSTASWALVTGASDGIGRGFAEELLDRGFNVILHGRNEAKLERVKSDLHRTWPTRQIRIMVCDAGLAAEQPSLLENAVEHLDDIPIKILVNNVGGGAKPLWVRLQDHTSDSASKFLNIDCRFMTDLTRLLMPRLIADQPSLIINIGSFVSDLPAPYISVLGGAKAYGKAWSRSLALEMKIEGHDVQVMHVQVGMVSTANDPRPLSLLVPSARQMACTTLDKVGSGQTEVFGYWPHELHSHMLTKMPGFVREPLLMRIVKDLKSEEEAEVGQRDKIS